MKKNLKIRKSKKVEDKFCRSKISLEFQKKEEQGEWQGGNYHRNNIKGYIQKLKDIYLKFESILKKPANLKRKINKKHLILRNFIMNSEQQR